MKILGNKVIDLSSRTDYNPKEVNIYVPEELSYTCSIIPKIRVIDGKVYYSKRVDEDELLNELIGSFLAKKLNLDTVNYKVGIDDSGKLYAVSELFFDSNYKYSHLMPFVFNELAIFGTDIEKYRKFYCKDYISIFSKAMGDAILKLSALDIKMCQLDRHTHNIMIKTNKETKERTLAPAYDYGFSYSKVDMKPEEFFYYNPYMLISKNEPSIKKLIERYPNFYDYAKSMADTSMEDIINKVEKEHDLLLSDDQKRYYIDKDKEYSEVLKKVTGK